MKTRPIQRKLLTILLALCMVLSLVPMVALAAPSAASDTADFTVQGGTPAIDLLNQYRTGTGISSWDNSSKTLTLRGIDFTTTAQTAVKLPPGPPSSWPTAASMPSAAATSRSMRPAPTKIRPSSALWTLRAASPSRAVPRVQAAWRSLPAMSITAATAGPIPRASPWTATSPSRAAM